MKTPAGTSVRVCDLRPGDLFKYQYKTIPTMDCNSLRCLIGVVPLPDDEIFCQITFISQGHIYNLIVNKNANYMKVR